MAAPANDNRLILDSWPLLELLQEREPATSQFELLIEHSLRSGQRLWMSRINFGEVVYNLHRELSADIDKVMADLAALPIDVISVDDDLVDSAALLKARFPLSYADCFAAALAMRWNAPVVTGDPDFKMLAERDSLRLHWLGA